MRALLLLWFLAVPGDGTWRLILEQEGFRTYEAATTPRYYRAEAVLRLDLAEFVAVFSDIPRQQEWVSHLVESRVLEGQPLERHVVYSRYHLPWPLKDRDTVLERVVTRLPAEGRVVVRFHQTTHPSAPPRENCIRIPITEGEFALKEVGPDTLRIGYTVRLDPGGWLPMWLVRSFVKDAPLQTLKAFQAQVQRTRGQYTAFVARERSRWDQEKARAR